jgi:hypothetical protein
MDASSNQNLGTPSLRCSRARFQSESARCGWSDPNEVNPAAPRKPLLLLTMQCNAMQLLERQKKKKKQKQPLAAIPLIARVIVVIRKVNQQ